MATYTELKALEGQGPISGLVEVAIWIKATAIIGEASPTVGRLAWAETALASPAGEVTKLVRYLLATNKAVTAAQILGATDPSVQAAVEAAVNKLHP